MVQHGSCSSNEVGHPSKASRRFECDDSGISTVRSEGGEFEHVDDVDSETL